MFLPTLSHFFIVKKLHNNQYTNMYHKHEQNLLLELTAYSHLFK